MTRVGYSLSPSALKAGDSKNSLNASMSRSHPTLGRSGIMWHTICVCVLTHVVCVLTHVVCVGTWGKAWEATVKTCTSGLRQARVCVMVVVVVRGARSFGERGTQQCGQSRFPRPQYFNTRVANTPEQSGTP